MTQKILIVTTNADKIGDTDTGVWLEEFAVPYEEFVDNGFMITIASPKGGSVPIDPKSEDKKYEDFKPLLLDAEKLDTIDYKDFDALFLPGGHGPMVDLAHDETLAKIVSYIASANKVIAAVCHGPAGLLSAKTIEGRPFVSGKKLTAYSNMEEKLSKMDDKVPFSLEDSLNMLGADYEAGIPMLSHTVTDGKLVTGQNPASSKKLAKEVVDLLSCSNIGKE